MSRSLVCSFLSTLVFTLAGCSTDEDDVLTKEEARQADHKSDGSDVCADNGWYGDGVCDDFCASPDPDCTTPSGKTCGGFAGLTCAEGEYCRYEISDTCGFADAGGVCTPRPDACITLWDPVCGCDGNTYSNSCDAANRGVSVRAPGECTPAERICGGFAGLTCGEGEYCHYEVADMCGYADASGVCRTRPEVCITLYAPVCGCDGNTYSNACNANGAGVSVRADGECR